MKDKSKRINYLYIVCFAILIAVIAFLSFYKLGVKYVDPWDEARHGVNAYEMAHGGSLFQNTYMRQADYYNLKPPLSMYSIILSSVIFGDGVFALRFMSAVCYILLAIAVGFFARRYGKLESLLAVAFLAVNTTPFTAHMIRSGDADSLYILFFTLAMLCMMRISDNKKYLYACGFLFALAFLTKSFHSGVIAVIGILYLIFTGCIKKLKIKDWLIFLIAILVPIACWALPRATIDGMTFFRAMWNTDVMGRTDGTLQSNIVPFWYYFQYFFGAGSGKATVYLCAFVICLIGIFVYPDIFKLENKKSYLGFVLWFSVPFLAFSAVSNKLLWYVYPTLIPLLMAAGILSARIIKEVRLGRALRIGMAAAVTVILIFYGRNILTTINAQGPNEFQEIIKESVFRSKLTGCNVYVDYNLKTDEETDAEGDFLYQMNADWSQQDVFVAEAYGDYHCVNGGILGLLSMNSYSGQEGLLFVGRDVYNKITANQEEINKGNDSNEKVAQESEEQMALDLTPYLDRNNLVMESEGYMVFKIMH